MYLLVYGMLVNVIGIYYVHVCEQAHWTCSAGNSAIENVCIIIICVVCVYPLQLEEPLLQTAKDKMMKLAEAVTDIGQCRRVDRDIHCINNSDDTNDIAVSDFI